MEKDISKICKKLFFLTGEIGYYNLANNIERADELVKIDDEELDR